MYDYTGGLYMYAEDKDEEPSWKKFKDEQDKQMYELMLMGVNLKKIIPKEPTAKEQYDLILTGKKK
jgi:hypothetical protein